jgi:hypothetical protein
MCATTANHASASELIYTAGPTALDYTSWPTVYGVQYAYQAVDFWGADGSYDYARSQSATSDEWVATGLYNSTSWYHPYEDPPTFPPDNSTIHQVWMYADVALNSYGTRTFFLQYAINESKATIDAGTAVWHTGDPTSGGYPDSSIVKSVTSVWPNYYPYSTEITGNESWNASMLRENVWVRLYTEDLGSLQLLVDYVGIVYTWTYDEGSSPPEEEGGSAGMFGVGSWFTMNSAFGIVGFTGMVIFPAVAIWMYKRSEAPKLVQFVQLLAVFMFCFTLFYASLPS